MSSISNNFFVQGNMIVAGTIQTGGNITSTGTISGNTLSIADGLNLGIITQASTEFTLSSTGNRVAIADSNNLIFKNDSSIQRTAYTGRHKIDPVDIHGFIQNRIIIKQTVSLQNPNLGLVSLGSNVYLLNIGTLRKGQVIRGVFVWSGVDTNGLFGLYSQSNGTLVAQSPLMAPVSTGMTYANFSSVYTIPTTQVYYIGVRLPGGVTLLGLSTNVYLNYGFSAATGILSLNTQLITASYSFLPSSLTGITMAASNTNIFAGVYG